MPLTPRLLSQPISPPVIRYCAASIDPRIPAHLAANRREPTVLGQARQPDNPKPETINQDHPVNRAEGPPPEDPSMKKQNTDTTPLPSLTQTIYPRFI